MAKLFRSKALPQLLHHMASIRSDGGVYTGQWNGNVREGKGRLQNADGGLYEGDFLNNAAHVRVFSTA